MVVFLVNTLGVKWLGFQELFGMFPGTFQKFAGTVSGSFFCFAREAIFEQERR